MDERRLFLEQLRLGQHATQAPQSHAPVGSVQLAYAPLVASGYATARLPRNRSSNDKSGVNSLSALFGLKRSKSKSNVVGDSLTPSAPGASCAIGSAVAVHANYAYGTVGTVGGGQMLQLLATNPQVIGTACYPTSVLQPISCGTPTGYAMPVNGSASLRCIPTTMSLKQRATILPPNWSSVAAANAAYMAQHPQRPAYALQHEYTYAEQISIAPVALPATVSVIPNGMQEMHVKGNGRSTLARLKRKSAANRVEKCDSIMCVPSMDPLNMARSELDLRQAGGCNSLAGSLRGSRSSSNLHSSGANPFATVNERFLSLFRKSNSTKTSKSSSNESKKGTRKSILDSDLTAYDLVRQELEGQPAAVKQNPLRSSMDARLCSSFGGDLSIRSQRSLTPPPTPTLSTILTSNTIGDQSRLVQSYGESLDKLHQNHTVSTANHTKSTASGSLRIAGQGVNLWSKSKPKKGLKINYEMGDEPNEIEVEEEEGHNTRMHVYRRNFERLPSLRRIHSVDSLPTVPEPDYDDVDDGKSKSCKSRTKSNVVSPIIPPSRPLLRSKCISSTSMVGSARCSSLSSSSSFSSNSSAEDCTNPTSSSSGCSIDSAEAIKTSLQSELGRDKTSSNGSSIVVKSILKKSTFGLESSVDCGHNSECSCVCATANHESVLIQCHQRQHPITRTVSRNGSREADRPIDSAQSMSSPNGKSVSTFKSNRPKKQVHFRSSFDQTLIVEQIEHIMEENEKDDMISSDLELEDGEKQEEEEEKEDEDENQSIVLGSPSPNRHTTIESQSKTIISSVNQNHRSHRHQDDDDEEGIYDDIGLRVNSKSSNCPERQLVVAGPSEHDQTITNKLVVSNQSSLASVSGQTNANTANSKMQLNCQLSHELDQLVSEFREFNPASSKPAASNWSTNSVSPNKSTKTIADTKSSVHQPAAIEQSISKLDRAEDNGRCMSSASSTCTYASCSSNYASDASSVSYTYSPLDTNAVSQRISRSAILQNFQQRSSGASSTNERNHGCQSTDSGNHSDESLGVDETTTVSSTLDTKNLPSVNSKIESANAINRIVIDVPPADAYEPFQSEHIYEELRCSSTSYSPDRRSIFEGASRQQILEYLADAKRRVERLIQNGADCDLDTMTSAPDCSSSLMLENARKRSLPPTPPIRTDSIKNSSSTVVTTKTTSFVGTSGATAGPSNECKSSKTSSGSDCSDCSECIECTFANGSVTVERQDSGVGAETSASACVHNHELSRSLCTLKIDSDRIANNGSISNACVDCDQSLVNAAIGKFGASHSLPLASSLGGPATTRRQSSLCSKCEKRRTERKEIIAEFVDTEFKYGRDLRIIREEFHRPIRVAGLLSAAQLDGVFANLDELIQVNSRFSEKLQDTLDLATEQGDADFASVHIGRVFMESTEMLHSFESYCIRQASASLLLAQLVKEKELLRVFLRVSQMENPLLRRMNLSAFLMVPVQRVTRYPLLLNRLHKVTSPQHPDRSTLRDAQQKVELHLEHINQQTKEAATSNRIWRRISNLSTHTNTNARRISQLDDIVDIKVKKVALESLQWPREQCEFVLCGRLCYGSMPDLQLTRKSRSLKMPIVNALLIAYFDSNVVDGKANVGSCNVKQAVLLLIKEKSNRYQLCRPPMYLNTCVISCEPDCDEYFEIHEIESKESLLLRAEIKHDSSEWLKQLRTYSSKVGNWRKRRNALPNIMMTMNKE